MLRTTIVAALLAASGTAAAADQDKGLLFGIGAGSVDYDTGFDIDDTTTAWKVYAGYRFSPNFTVEAAYIDGGEISGEVVTGLHVTADTTAVQLSATGGWWFTDVFGAYVRAGWTSYESDQRASALGITVSEDVSQDDLGYGLGLQVKYDGALVRLEYETTDVDGSDVTVTSLNVGWQF